jgi:hypothetical protein
MMILKATSFFEKQKGDTRKTFSITRSFVTKKKKEKKKMSNALHMLKILQ